MSSELLQRKENGSCGEGFSASRRWRGRKPPRLHLATHGEVDDRVSLRSAGILSRDALLDPERQPEAALHLRIGLPLRVFRMVA